MWWQLSHPFVLSLSKHVSYEPTGLWNTPFDKLRANGREDNPRYAATLTRSTPDSELGSARTMSTSTKSPIVASVSRWTDCSQGDLPSIWPGSFPVRSIRT